MEKSAAFYAGIESAFEKEALFGFGKIKPKFKPSFKGHSKAISDAVGSAKKVSPAGVVTKRQFNPNTQMISQKRHVTGVPGWTQ